MPAGRRPVVILDAPSPQVIPEELVGGECRQGERYRIFDDQNCAEEAKSICRMCPVRKICLAYAVHNEPHGVWGGTTPMERRELRLSEEVIDPWQRQVAAEFRLDLGSPMTASQVARKWNMTERTVERNRSRLRDIADAA